MGREERKIQILKAAVRVFFQQGFERARIEEIAGAAGIGKGTVYEYFPSKQQLFDETMLFAANIFIQEMKESMDGAETIKDKIIAFARYQTSFIHKHSPVLKILCSSQVKAREMGAAILQQNARLTQLWREVLQKAKAEKELKEGLNEELAAAVIIGTINQYCNKSVIFQQENPETILYEEVADMIFHGINGTSR